MTTVLEQGNISIHTENIFPIIKKWLYSDHEIFLRELVSNAVDAIKKMDMVSRSGEFSGAVGDHEITIKVDKDAKTLSVTDTGIGMTADEVKKYINQVAFSSAEEFVEKYQNSGDDAIIGHFGLGFYSSFMVSSQVEIDTLSYQEGASAVHWSCDGSTQFEISESSRSDRGTTITLHLMDEEEEYLEQARIRQLIRTYCDFMPVPIKMETVAPPAPPASDDEEKEGEETPAESDVTAVTFEQVNKQIAPWKKSPSEMTDEDYKEFYNYLYPFQEEPLLWVHINTDYPFLVNGILYFPKLKPDLDVTKGHIKLYCNQVFVSENCEEVIPKFLLPLQGVIDSVDIPLNVSRSFLQADRTVRGIANHIAKKVGDRLKELYRDDRQQYIKSWQDLGTFVKFGTLNDDKFKKQIEDILIYRTTAKLGAATEAAKVEVQTEGDDVWEDVPATDPAAVTDDKGFSYTTLKEYLERNKETHENRVFYCNDPSAQATYVELHKNNGLEVLFLDSFIDTHFISFLEREYTDVKFSRVDAELDDTLVDKEQEKEVVDPNTNKTRSETIKELFEKVLEKPNLNIKTQALKSDDPSTPPAMVLLPEAMRRLRDMMAMSNQDATMQFPEEHILMINTAHPLVQNVLELNQGAIVTGDGGESPSAKMANMLCHHIYDLALMGQKSFGPDEMKTFLERSNQVLTQLTKK